MDTNNILNHLGKIHSISVLKNTSNATIKVVIFFWGCPLHCLHCHRPATWGTRDYSFYTKEALLKKILKYKQLYSSSLEVVISGGEPMHQHNFLLDFLPLLKQENIKITFSTSGACYNESMQIIFNQYVDIVILNLKSFSEENHKLVTGKSLAPVMHFIEYLNQVKRKLLISYVLVENLNDHASIIHNMVNFLIPYKDIIKKIDIIPFQHFNSYQWDEIRKVDPLKNTENTSPINVEKAKQLFVSNGFYCP